MIDVILPEDTDDEDDPRPEGPIWCAERTRRGLRKVQSYRALETKFGYRRDSM